MASFKGKVALRTVLEAGPLILKQVARGGPVPCIVINPWCLETFIFCTCADAVFSLLKRHLCSLWKGIYDVAYLEFTDTLL